MFYVLVHVLSPNVYRTPQESLQAFKWFCKVGNWEEHFAKWEQLLVIYVGAAAMFFIGKNLKRRHQLKDDVRESFYEDVNVWLKALKKKGTKFMGGDEP
ncbi:prostaglandin E synthase 2-like [Macrobrachium nipponense]|uniref:prostaglandin E synthase 2-like n=1 Tax=Macrobrachium nipponense TaxID=159736 RepID=UPI0030C8D197